MFKSAEKLRHEAAQRQLDRVASSWRNARTTWFDGTPQSIEARLAETNRILAVARSGYSPAHLGLTVEAENARRELMAARHRLLEDFLDDGARAFQGSRRVAGEGMSYDDTMNHIDSVLAEGEGHDLGNYPGAERIPGPAIAESGYVQNLHDRALDPEDEWWRGKIDAEYDRDNPHAWGETTQGKGGMSRADWAATQNHHYQRGYNEESATPGAEYRALHGSRVARAPEENENWEEGANYAEYKGGKCTRCKSDNIDAAGYGTGEYDCYDCGATFHPKVRKLKSHRTAGWEDELDNTPGLRNLSESLGRSLIDGPAEHARTYHDEDGPGLPGGMPDNVRQHLDHPDPVQGAYNAGWEASGGNGSHSPYLDHEDPVGAAETDYYRAGGRHADAFHDGWLDYASEIPHRYNDAAGHAGHPEGYFKGASLHTAAPHEPWCAMYDDHDGPCQGLTDLTWDRSPEDRRPWGSPEEEQRARDRLNGEGYYAD